MRPRSRPPVQRHALTVPDEGVPESSRPVYSFVLTQSSSRPRLPGTPPAGGHDYGRY